MFPLQWLVLVLVPLAVAQPAPPACCATKTVGGVSYTFVREDSAAMSYSCLSSCVYERDDQPGTAFCFAQGDQQVVCGDSTQVGSCQCGVKKSRRIIGGSETEVNEYPWMVVFANKAADNQGGCGATLISDTWVVTAAHCFFDESGDRQIFEADLSLVIGLHDRTVDTDEFRQVLEASEIILHPGYTWDSSANDIALVKLTSGVDLNTYSPACLPEQGQDFAGQRGWVYGWGVTNYGDTAEDFPEKLLEVEVPIVSDEICQEALLGLATILPGMLCAGGVANEDACGGDSGGPLTVDVGGSHTLAGAVSFGASCGREGLYGVYAEVGDYRNWIDETIGSNGGATFCN